MDCHFCTSLGKHGIEKINETHVDMLQIIIPYFDPEKYADSKICKDCDTLIIKIFNFKSSCLELEDNIYSYKTEEVHQINLEKIIGLTDICKAKICRTCLEIIDDDFYVRVNNGDNLLRQHQQKCLAEMNFTLTKEPVMCISCIQILEKYFNLLKCFESHIKTAKDKELSMHETVCSKKKPVFQTREPTAYEDTKNHQPMFKIISTETVVSDSLLSNNANEYCQNNEKVLENQKQQSMCQIISTVTVSDNSVPIEKDIKESQNYREAVANQDQQSICHILSDETALESSVPAEVNSQYDITNVKNKEQPLHVCQNDKNDNDLSFSSDFFDNIKDEISIEEHNIDDVVSTKFSENNAICDENMLPNKHVSTAPIKILNIKDEENYNIEDEENCNIGGKQNVDENVRTENSNSSEYTAENKIYDDNVSNNEKLTETLAPSISEPKSSSLSDEIDFKNDIEEIIVSSDEELDTCSKTSENIKDGNTINEGKSKENFGNQQVINISEKELKNQDESITEPERNNGNEMENYENQQVKDISDKDLENNTKRKRCTQPQSDESTDSQDNKTSGNNSERNIVSGKPPVKRKRKMRLRSDKSSPTEDDRDSDFIPGYESESESDGYYHTERNTRRKTAVPKNVYCRYCSHMFPSQSRFDAHMSTCRSRPLTVIEKSLVTEISNLREQVNKLETLHTSKTSVNPILASLLTDSDTDSSSVDSETNQLLKSLLISDSTLEYPMKQPKNGLRKFSNSDKNILIRKLMALPTLPKPTIDIVKKLAVTKTKEISRQRPKPRRKPSPTITRNNYTSSTNQSFQSLPLRNNHTSSTNQSFQSLPLRNNHSSSTDQSFQSLPLRNNHTSSTNQSFQSLPLRNNHTSSTNQSFQSLPLRNNHSSSTDQSFQSLPLRNNHSSSTNQSFQSLPLRNNHTSSTDQSFQSLPLRNNHTSSTDQSLQSLPLRNNHTSSTNQSFQSLPLLQGRLTSNSSHIKLFMYPEPDLLNNQLLIWSRIPTTQIFTDFPKGTPNYNVAKSCQVEAQGKTSNATFSSQPSSRLPSQSTFLPQNSSKQSSGPVLCDTNKILTKPLTICNVRNTNSEILRDSSVNSAENFVDLTSDEESLDESSQLTDEMEEIIIPSNAIYTDSAIDDHFSDNAQSSIDPLALDETTCLVSTDPIDLNIPVFNMEKIETKETNKHSLPIEYEKSSSQKEVSNQVNKHKLPIGDNLTISIDEKPKSPEHTDKNKSKINILSISVVNNTGDKDVIGTKNRDCSNIDLTIDSNLRKDNDKLESEINTAIFELEQVLGVSSNITSNEESISSIRSENTKTSVTSSNLTDHSYTCDDKDNNTTINDNMQLDDLNNGVKNKKTTDICETGPLNTENQLETKDDNAENYVPAEDGENNDNITTSYSNDIVSDDNGGNDGNEADDADNNQLHQNELDTINVHSTEILGDQLKLADSLVKHSDIESPSVSKINTDNVPESSAVIVEIDSDDDIREINETQSVVHTSTLNTLKEKIINRTSLNLQQPIRTPNSALVLNNHHVNPLELAIFKCDWCPFNTRYFQLIELHIMTHFNKFLRDDKYYCPRCTRVFTKKINLTYHLQKEHTRFCYKLCFWCVNCSSTFPSKTDVTRHTKKCHKRNISVKLFKCNNVVYCMLCYFETTSVVKAKEHTKSCYTRIVKTTPTEVIELE